MSELPAWSLPAGAAKDIALGADWPAELTHEWAYGGAAGRACATASSTAASMRHIRWSATSRGLHRPRQHPANPLRKPPYCMSLFDSMSATTPVGCVVSCRCVRLMAFSPVARTFS
jgi:hypothetical protein